MFRRRCKPVILGACVVLLSARAAAGLAGPTVTALNLVSSVDYNSTHFENTYTITVKTDLTAVSGVLAIASSTVASTKIHKGKVNLGNLPGNSTLTSTDTLVVLQSKKVTLNPASLTWVFEGENGPTVHLTAVASGASGDVLLYQWKTTDGTLANVNGAQADWTLPPGPGLHFAYALVSNGKGAYIERRVAVNTDASGIAVRPGTPITRTPPAGPASIPNPTYVGVLVGSLLYPPFASEDITAPPGLTATAAVRDATVKLTSTTAPIVHLGPFKTDIDGSFYLPSTKGPLGYYNASCSLDGTNFFSCGTSTGFFFDSLLNQAPTNALTVNPFNFFSGSAALADGNTCGVSDRFFGADVAATATLLDAQSVPIGPSVRMSRDGTYLLPTPANAATIVLRCENASPIALPVPTSSPYMVGRSVFSDSTTPVISIITATLGGQSVGLFLPPPLGFPSDGIPSSTHFLTVMGLDTKNSACQYYLATGAAGSCNAAGNFKDGLTFDDWRRSVQIDEFAPSGAPPTYVAEYINKVDLNLARDQHSISYGPNQTAAYVCNHLGPTVLNPSQSTDAPGNPSIDTVVDNLVQGKNLVACVAMDYQAWPNVNGGKPLTRFLIFGPSGQLLPSVNLDGRAEKWMPGVCVSCHGADRYYGHFPTDGTGVADIGAHFLPYDPANFEFSSKTGLRLVDQEPGLYGLNQNVLDSGPTDAITDLIHGWYAGGNTVNQNYAPTEWSQFVWGTSTFDVSQYFVNLFGKGGCRTCHVAVASSLYFEPARMNYGYDLTCLSGSYTSWDKLRSMPQSLVTFNRFWTSIGGANGPDEPALMSAFEQILEGGTQGCTLP